VPSQRSRLRSTFVFRQPSPLLLAPFSLPLALHRYPHHEIILDRDSDPIMAAPDSVPLLPANVELKNLAEGAANLIYRFTILPSTPPSTITEDLENDGAPLPSAISPSHDPRLDGKLLRLRKALPSSQSNLQAYHDLHNVFFPLFPSSLLVEQDLVELPAGLLHAENAVVRKRETSGLRSKKRVGLYLEESEPYGFLVTDMTADFMKGEVLVEFKPKWVLPSPSAPSGWKRCRTCALRAQRNTKKAAKGETLETGFCPLDLASGDRDRVTKAVRHLVPKVEKLPPGQMQGLLEKRISEFLLETPMLSILKERQGALDKLGVLKTDPNDLGFLRATTLRDCTVYIKVIRLHSTALGDF
jgi:inositol-pentakisphosphate 2-kinase